MPGKIQALSPDEEWSNIDKISSLETPSIIPAAHSKASATTTAYEDYYTASSMKAADPETIHTYSLGYMMVQLAMKNDENKTKKIEHLLNNQDRYISQLEMLKDLSNLVNKERKAGEKEEEETLDLSKDEHAAVLDKVRKDIPSISTEGKYVFKGKEIDLFLGNINREIEVITSKNKPIMMQVQTALEDRNTVVQITKAALEDDARFLRKVGDRTGR